MSGRRGSSRLLGWLGLSIVAMLPFASAAAAATDPNEPNDDLAHATGPLGYDAAHSSASGLVERTTDPDVFVMYLSPGRHHLKVTLHNPNTCDDACMQVH